VRQPESVWTPINDSTTGPRVVQQRPRLLRYSIQGLAQLLLSYRALREPSCHGEGALLSDHGAISRHIQHPGLVPTATPCGSA
jgi:hypothetical protein